METIEAERPNPPPPRPPIHLADSESAAPSGEGTPAPAAAGSNDHPGEPSAQAAEAADAATPALGAEVVEAGKDGLGSTAQDEVEGDGGDGIGELPGLPEFPSGDLDFDDEPAQPDLVALPDDDIDLAPLPTEFDPDAPLPDLPPASLLEDDELAIVPREEPEPVPEPEPPAPAQVEEAPPENTEQQDHDFYALIRGLADPGLEGEGEGEMGMGTEEQTQDGMPDGVMDVDELAEGTAGQSPSPAPSSPLTPLPPLSPVPELPTELSLDADIPVSRHPSSALAPELQTYSAESSSAALRRTRATSSSASLHHDELARRRGQSPSRSEDRDELGSDGGEKRERYKRRKGLDGKLIRASARPRKRIDKQLQIERHGQRPPEKVAPRAKTLSEMRLKAMVRGKTRETQLAPCIRPRYGQWGKCTQCVSKIGGDSCRFRNYRIFPLNPETGDITGPGWFESTKLEEPLTPMKDTFNVTLTEEHITRTEKTVAPLLVGLISKEMRHVIKNNALYRPIDTAQHRSVCDFCSSTIFAGFWFCQKCGRDYCIDCERFFSESSDNINTSPWPVPDATRPRLHRCTRGDEPLPLPLKPPKTSGKLKQVNHYRPDLKAASRLSANELRADFMALINFVLEPGSSDMDIEARVASLNLGDDETELADIVRRYLVTASPNLPPTKSPLSEDQIQELYEVSKTLPQPPDPTEIKPQPFMFIDGDRLDNLDGAFDALWARGEPLVVDNLLKRLKRQWTPDNFLRRFKAEDCYVVDCQTEKIQLTSVGAFFLLFKELGGEVSVPSQAANGSATGSPAMSASSTPGLNESARVTEIPADPRSQHEPMVVDERSRVSSHAPDSVTANGGAGETVQACTPSETQPLTTNGNDTTMSPTSAASASQPPSSAATTARPILPAPTHAGHGSAPGSGMTTPRRTFTFEEQVAQMTSWAPGYAKLKAAKRIYKLKDWPSTDDFASAYPDLYEDFSHALPAPDFTQRIGVLNLYSHFPPGPTRPDIGPKMYNALAGREDPKGYGSTRLHMDVADAVNIMLYASKRPDGTPGCAVWDIFRAEDADKIRTFLRAKYPNTKMTDPIHSQLFFLNSKLRTELYEQYGVASFRVYQYPGQAVFVPAGCAHQVCNLANCMKIALDFVSPHNVRRCQQLMQDFRKENYQRVWKEDVLQLYNVMWYAWTNVRSIRERRKRQAIRDREAAARQAEYFARLRAGQAPPLRGPPHPGVYAHPRPPYPHPHPHPQHSHAPSNRADPRPYPFAPAMSSVRDDRAAPPPPSAAGSSGAQRPPETAGVIAENGSRSATPQATPTAPAQTIPPLVADNTAPSSTTSPATATEPPSAPAALSAAESQANDKDGEKTDSAQESNTSKQGTSDFAAQEQSPPLASDKNPESASASARPIPPTNGPPPSGSQTSPPASPPPPSPRQTLALRLLDAALERIPKPELHVEPPPKQPSAPPTPSYSYGREPVRYTDSYRQGHLPPDLIEQVMRSQMGAFNEDVDMLG